MNIYDERLFKNKNKKIVLYLFEMFHLSLNKLLLIKVQNKINHSSIRLVKDLSRLLMNS